MCLREVGIDGKIMLKWMAQHLEMEVVDWIHLSWDRDK
jgi:hypothetical protein